jgi:hypothetical protein
VTYTLSTGVTTGDDYLFRVRAKNDFGWGAYSNEVTLTAADVPDQMVLATTEIESDGDVKISWTAPSDNGADITAYKIEIFSQSSTWLEETTNCDGTDGTIMSNLYCSIPMATLTAGGTFTLPENTLVEVRLSATNSIGSSTVSSTNTGDAYTAVEPD